jgi:hypothetical protein
MRSFHFALVSVALLACTQLPLVTPPAPSDFELTLSHARRNVDSGNYWAADRLLEEFVRTHPDTREAREIAFWKAAYLVDPANDRGSLPAGIAALDAYLAADSAGWYKNEAIVLRRTAIVAQGVAPNATGVSRRTSTTASGSTSPTGATDTVVVVSRSRDEEIAALKEQLAKSKEELAKVSAELERIKKRLANPSN